MAIRSSEILKTEYEVFLSFRGPDTRQGFTDVLYDYLVESGIQVFRDDDELEIGDTIELILDAIRNSKICVPIFSKSFASSAWCLREVAKMVELKKEIVPIFYDVTPDDVKLKTSLYVDQTKEQCRGKAQLEEWEKALVQVGRIKGRELKETGFAEFIKKFKEEILLKLRVQQKYTIKHLVQMADQVEEALKLLSIESVDVRFLGMYGMGGIGKTTLAKIIFNQISSSFDSCSFLANIREERSSKGVEYLRTKLLQDLNPNAVTNNNMNFRMKSILIVLDDVGERSHIEELVGDSISFGSRSRIIITTRDERALLINVAEASSSVEGSAKVSTTRITKMEVNGMNPKQAMQLFSRHAFGRNYPPEDYTSLSKDVISISAGLPLALEVIGSLLYGMSVEAWKHKVSKLKTIPADNVREKLMISYNALEEDVKEIFLDIACFFINKDKSNPIYMWEACGFGPNWAVPVLLSMSLIKITDDGKFWMHDQLRDLGREIVRIKENNSSTSREGSRIWTYKDALSVHARNKEKDVVGLDLRGSDDRLTDFADFGSLRFLQVDWTPWTKAFHCRNFWRLSTDITWLSLRLNKPNITASIRSMFSMVSRNHDSSYLMKLAVLNLSYSDITDSWEGWILIQELRRLKVLDLTRCEKLTRTPNFSKMEALEKLILQECSTLAKIDSSIGKLRKLKYLNLESCHKLKELPEEVGSLEDLEQIIITGRHLSNSPGDLGAYSFKSAGGLKELPATIGMLAKLEHLNLSYCECLHKLPDSIGDLTSLASLDLSYCDKIEELPSSVTRLEKLERLTLRSCEKLVKLPDDLGKLELLVELDFSHTSVTAVPESIGDLARIQVINLSGTPVRVLPGTIAQLSLLQKLDLSGCDRIERLPELPASLTDLDLSICSLRQAPDLSMLGQLRVLKIRDDKGGRVQPLQQETDRHYKFDAIGKLLRLEYLDLDIESQMSLPAEFSALTKLKSLELTAPNLTCIPPFPSSLRSLTLKNLGRETKLPCLSNLNNLYKLEFSRCSMEGGILDCGVDRLVSLIQLKVEWCDTIDKLPDLSRLKRLEELWLHSFKELVEIPGLGTLVSLKSLYISYCDSLERLENIKNLTSLRHVYIGSCENFQGIQGLEELRESRIWILISECKCKDFRGA